LMDLLEIADNEQLCRFHKKLVEEILKSRINRRDTKWTESIAIGSRQYVQETRTKLGIKAKRRSIEENNEAYELR
jgi:putative transposase